MGCERQFSWANYREAVESGRQQIAVVQEMESLFPGEVQNFIGHDGGTISQPMTWNSEALLYDRYELTMQVKIRVNASFSEVTEVIGDPEFYLVEVLKTERTNGGWHDQNGQNWNFGGEEWEQLVAAKGDFSAIGIHLKKDQPVDNFREATQHTRNQREPPT
jgi:hypothetical protein